MRYVIFVALTMFCNAAIRASHESVDKTASNLEEEATNWFGMRGQSD
jgi:hypothetical protein